MHLAKLDSICYNKYRAYNIWRDNSKHTPNAVSELQYV